MAKESRNQVLHSEVIEARIDLSLTDLCEFCSVSSEHIVRLVDEGLVEPVGREPSEWRFSGRSVRRIVVAERLARDLRLNPAGAALVLDLLDEVKQLRQRLLRFDDTDES